jgi:hypothetical protein
MSIAMPSVKPRQIGNRAPQGPVRVVRGYIARDGEVEHEVVMQVERLAVGCRDLVDIDRDEGAGLVVVKDDARLLAYLAARRVDHRRIAYLHMPARLKPPAESLMIHEQHVMPVRREYDGAGGDVTRVVVRPVEGRDRELE